MTRTVVFKGGPRSGDTLLGWDGGDFIFVADKPPAPSLSQGAPKVVEFGLRKGAYKFRQMRADGVEIYDWCGWDDGGPDR